MSERVDAYLIRDNCQLTHQVIGSGDGRRWVVAVYTAADGAVYRSAPQLLEPEMARGEVRSGT